jgi:hypothetical protein
MYIEKEIPFDFRLETDGSGFWTASEKEIQATKIVLNYYTEDDELDIGLYGELRVYYDTNTWDIKHDGLPYTDKQFLDDLRGCLEVMGLNDEDIEYSEQGMQGKDYVSLDVGQEFISSWTFKEWADSELPGK